MGNTVTLTFAGDSKSLERTFDRVGGGAKEMAADFDKAGADVKRFGSSVDNMNDKVDASESKFMGTADLLDGLGSAFGLPLEGATSMARAFGDLAGGFASVVGPAITKVAGMLGIQTAATTAQTTATAGAATAQTGLNTALMANPIGLVIAALALLVGGFVLAWKNSETFRDVVRGALNIAKSAAEGLANFFMAIPEKIGAVGGRLVEIITWPYKTAFNAIARLWNNTVGRLSFEIPSWVPGMGGKGFSMPNLPTFHMGGTIPGNPGTAVPIMAMAGETVVRAGQGGGGNLIIQAGAIVTENQLADLVQKALLRKQARTGSLGFA